MSLVGDTGFDPYDTGTPADSWRQQPNSPAYSTVDDVVEMNRAAHR
ncbi:hypothetical protein ACFWCA_03345 [Streptomyces phaeochromogenes]